MDSYEVNAEYSERDNSIFIPSGILQPPFMDLSKSFTYNLSFIGVIICHELIHSLDDEGCKYDENGLYKNWWNDEDRKNYKIIEKAILKLYTHFTTNKEDIEKIKLGENIADVGSMSITEDILEHYLDENNITDIAKKEYYKEFYKSYAKLYKKQNYESFMPLSNNDAHSYAKYRVNCVLANSTKFKQCFDITPNDKMFYHDEIIQNIW